MTLSRRQARRQALFLLYQWDLSAQPIGSQYEGEIDPWARGVAESVASRAEELDARITGASEGWTADRLEARSSAARYGSRYTSWRRATSRFRSRSTRRSPSSSGTRPMTAPGW